MILAIQAFIRRCMGHDIWEQSDDRKGRSQKRKTGGRDQSRRGAGALVLGALALARNRAATTKVDCIEARLCWHSRLFIHLPVSFVLARDALLQHPNVQWLLFSAFCHRVQGLRALAMAGTNQVIKHHEPIL